MGTVAEVSEKIRLPGGGRAVSLSGQHRALIGAAQTGPSGELRVEVDERADDVPVDKRTRELEREYRATVEEILELRGDDGRIAAFLRAQGGQGVAQGPALIKGAENNADERIRTHRLHPSCRWRNGRSFRRDDYFD